MMLAHVRDNGLGITLNPIKAVKWTAKTATRAVTHPVSTVKKTVSAATHPIRSVKYVARQAGDAASQVGTALKRGVLKPAEWLASKATAPLRSRVLKLRQRRAVKLAWDKRRSKQPNAAEQAEAKSWTKSRLKSSGPQGYLLALFAGADTGVLMGAYDVHPRGLGFDPATASVIAASIPVLMAILNAVLSNSAKSGEAPADPGADAAAEAAEAQAAGESPGAVDMGPAQDQAAADAIAAQGGGDGDAGGGMRSLIPGGAKKSNMLLYAGIGGAVLLVLMLVGKKKD